jgi:aspartokinase
VQNARHLPSIDYATMAEMAGAGARVLNVHAVTWAERHGLTLLARRTLDFVSAGVGRETRIEAGSNGALAIVANPALWLVCGPDAARDRLAETARKLELPLRALESGPAGLLGVVPLSSVPDGTAARHALERCFAGVEVVEGYAELSAIGAAVEDSQRRTAALCALAVEPRFSWRGHHRFSLILPLPVLAAAAS